MSENANSRATRSVVNAVVGGVTTSPISCAAGWRRVCVFTKLKEIGLWMIAGIIFRVSAYGRVAADGCDGHGSGKATLFDNRKEQRPHNKGLPDR